MSNQNYIEFINSYMADNDAVIWYGVLIFLAVLTRSHKGINHIIIIMCFPHMDHCNIVLAFHHTSCTVIKWFDYDKSNWTPPFSAINEKNMKFESHFHTFGADSY